MCTSKLTAKDVGRLGSLKCAFLCVVTIGGGESTSNLSFDFLTMLQNELKYMYWVNPENVPPPYNAIREFSTDGISYSPISWWATLPFGFYVTQFQNGFVIQTSQSLVAGNYTIRLKVTDNNNTEGVDYMLLRLFDSPGLVGGNDDVFDTRNQFAEEQDVTIYPSIIHAEDAIDNIKSEFENLEFILRDVSGNYVSGGMVIANQISLGDLLQGMYYLSIMSQNKLILTKRIVKQ